jgi:hypothetical protein
MRSVLVLFAVTACAGLVASNAAATQTNISSSDFHAYNQLQSSNIMYFGQSVTSNSTGTTQLIASVTHNPATTNVTVYVDGYHSTSGQSTSCTLLSYNYTGNNLASVTASTTTTLNWEITLTLTTAQMGPWAYFSVVCTIPPNQQGSLFGVTVLP